MNPGFDKNETEFGVAVFSVAVQMLADGDSFLDEHVQVLREFWGEAVCLQDAEDFVAGDSLNLGDTLRIAQVHTDLGRDHPLLRELANLVANLLRSKLQP